MNVQLPTKILQIFRQDNIGYRLLVKYIKFKIYIKFLFFFPMAYFIFVCLIKQFRQAPKHVCSRFYRDPRGSYLMVFC